MSLPADVKQSLAVMQDIVSLLGSIGTDTVSPGGGGSDIEALAADGVPALSPRTVGTHYFDWHHTEADTLDKVDPVEFREECGDVVGGGLCAGGYGWAAGGEEVGGG